MSPKQGADTNAAELKFISSGSTGMEVYDATMDSSGQVSTGEGVLSRKDYYKKFKKQTGELREVSPDKYISDAVRGLYSDSGRKQTYTEFLRQVLDSRAKTEWGRKNIESLKEKMRRGTPLDIPVVETSLTRGNSQEGLHRAIAAKELGIKSIPVLYSHRALMALGMAGVAASQAQAKDYNDDGVDGQKIIDILFDGTIKTEGLKDRQTPIRSKAKESYKGVKVSQEKDPGREAFIYTKTNAERDKLIRMQWYKYFSNPRKFGLTEKNTVGDVIRKMDQENPNSKIKFLKLKGIDADKITIEQVRFDLKSAEKEAAKREKEKR